MIDLVGMQFHHRKLFAYYFFLNRIMEYMIYQPNIKTICVFSVTPQVSFLDPSTIGVIFYVFSMAPSIYWNYETHKTGEWLNSILFQ